MSKIPAVLAACFFISLLAFALSIISGAVRIDLSQILNDEQSKFILMQLRLPRTLAAYLIGASLACCGLVLQTLLRNPLAEPYTLGLAGGSSLGAIAALALNLQPSTIFIPLLSTFGCLGAAFLVLGLAHRHLRYESRSLILFGVMVSLFLGAAVVTGLSVLSPQKLQSALFWLLGEFGTSRDSWIYSFSPVLVIGITFLLSRSRALDVLQLGEARAMSLGFSPAREHLSLILATTLITAMGVSIAGLVGFIGLVSPHLARRLLKSSDHFVLLIGCFFIGATLLVLADTVGRVIASPGEIPAGSVSALVGAPILLGLLFLGRSNASLE